MMILTVLMGGTAAAFEQTGLASWYGGDFQGKTTANGETFDTYDFTAAHKDLPFGTIVTVTNLENGKSVQVRINDRGPFVDSRIIDLSYAAAAEIGMVESGVAEVRIETTEFENLEVRYSIQVGAYASMEYSAAMVDQLEQAGLEPKAILTNTGVIRVIFEDIHEDELISMISRLCSLGFKNLMVKQN